MAAVMAYPPLAGPGDLYPAHDEIPSDAITSTWYEQPPSAYTDAYIAPYVTQAEASTSYQASTVDVTPLVPLINTDTPSWHSWGRHHTPDFSYLPQPLQPRQLMPTTFYRPHSSLENRPRSSPSTFGPSADSIHWPDSALDLRYTSQEAPVTLSSTYNPNSYAPITGPELFASPSPKVIEQPQPRRRYHALAPNPLKRVHDDDEDSGDFSNLRKRERTSSVVSADLNEDDKLLVTLKEDGSLSWKDIAARFGSHHGKTFQVAALQMRYKRLREKYRIWQVEDVEALKLAHECWEKYKWDIISSKMVDFGIPERWPSKHCARKWQKIAPQHSSATPQPQPTPSLSQSQFSSPESGPQHYAYLPMQ